jgi:alpha-tubulin suppressor-like RCC1 family protein
MAQWKQYSGVWTRQSQMQAAGAQNWPGVFIGNGLFSWGRNLAGQLGQNNVVNRSSPVQVGSLKTWSLVKMGTYNSVGVTNNGSLWTWGGNTYGQLGRSNLTNASSPVQVGALTNWSIVASGSNHVFAIKTDNSLWSWGWNAGGQLGQLDTVDRSSPVQVGNLTNWSSVSGGDLFSAAIKTDGTLWTWGSNLRGQLGLNIAYSNNINSPTQVGSLTNWKIVSCNTTSAAAVKTDGTLWSWGNNNQGQLGLNINPTIYRSSPVQVGALTTWSNIVCGALHTMAIKTDGTLWSWGYNASGQLGINAVTNRSSPVQVGAMTNWRGVAAGQAATLATKVDGTLWSWGSNGYGELGQNITYSSSTISPVQIGSGTYWTSPQFGWYSALAFQQNYVPG